MNHHMPPTSRVYGHQENGAEVAIDISKGRVQATWPLMERQSRPERQFVSRSTEAMWLSEDSTTFDVLAAIKIEAECWKVLSAISIPEYIEAWVKVPEGVRIDFCHDLSSENRLCINLTSSDANRSTYGSMLQTKPGRVTFLWKTVEATTVYPSVVDILLRDGPRKCTLRLRHIGIRSWDEKELLTKFWRLSLTNLRSLMC